MLKQSIPIALILVGCSSAPPQVEPQSNLGSNVPEIAHDRVLDRMNDASGRPSWLNEERPFEVKSGMVISLGQVSIPAADRVEAGYLIAENNAKGSLCSAIESRMDYVFQQAQEGTSVDSTQVHRIGAEACKLTTSAIRPGRRYWEKVATTDGSGSVTVRLIIFTTVEMPESDFKRAIIAAAKNQQGNGGLTEDFSKKVNEHWYQFVGGDHKPASE